MGKFLKLFFIDLFAHADHDDHSLREVAALNSRRKFVMNVPNGVFSVMDDAISEEWHEHSFDKVTRFEALGVAPVWWTVGR